MLTTPYDKYRQTQAQTANSSKLLLMLYDGAIRFVKAGIDGIENGRVEQANNNLLKAQAIIHELIATLNYDYEISNHLLSIYEYMLHQLIQSNLHKKKEPAEDVLDNLMELKDAWVQASRTDEARTQHMNNNV